VKATTPGRPDHRRRIRDRPGDRQAPRPVGTDIGIVDLDQAKATATIEAIAPAKRDHRARPLARPAFAFAISP
jgi:hypothetical protein